MTASMPDKGSAGTVAFSIAWWWQGSSKVGRAAFGGFDPWVAYGNGETMSRTV